MEHARALICLDGPDSESLLQGIITQDITLLETQPAIFTAMLSPQGKWQHDFFIIKHDNVIYIDHDAAVTETLLKRLKLYKMRADVSIRLCDEWHFALWPTQATAPSGGIHFIDPRHEALPARHWSKSPIASDVTTQDYAAIRVAHGIPEGGVDVTEKETALDVSYDHLHAVSFTKGCYVGQEVTARMHYKSVVRKGFFQVQSEVPLKAAGTIQCNGKAVAELRSHHGEQGIAFGRIDAVLTALDSDHPCDLNGQLVQLCPPSWQDAKLALYHQQQLEKEGRPVA